ncbi:hypothetical protein, partial [Pseudomonas aeruginosa]|uniref:hypothetical protein n=1 Tax=Pseudomonas aeruginosa TaxID=287 RepID=UPI0029BFBCC8
SFRQALFSKIFFSTQPLAPTFKPSSDQREAHSTAFKFAVKHLDEASFRTPFGTLFYSTACADLQTIFRSAGGAFYSVQIRCQAPR